MRQSSRGGGGEGGDQAVVKAYLDDNTVFIYYMIQLVVLPGRERPRERRVERLSSPWQVPRLPPPLGAGQGRGRPPQQASAPVFRDLIAVQPKLTYKIKCSEFREGFILDPDRKLGFKIFHRCRYFSDVTKFTLHSQENVNYILHFQNKICIKFQVSKNRTRIWKKNLVRLKIYARTVKTQKH